MKCFNLQSSGFCVGEVEYKFRGCGDLINTLSASHITGFIAPNLMYKKHNSDTFSANIFI